MSSDEKYRTTPHEPSPGSLERTASTEDDLVEKSLLHFIQERALQKPADDETGAPPESERSSWETSESADQTADLMAIRLGGNGF